jgi:predicted nucleic acid-binding protein
VIDASVAVKWFLPETHSSAARAYLDDNCERLAPDLLYAEFGNAVWKRARRAQLSADEARDVLHGLQLVPIEVYPVQPFLQAAFEIARVLNRTVYDALYLVLAAAHDCPLVTADRPFYEAVTKSELARNIRWVEAV